MATKEEILRIIEAAATKNGIPREDFLRFAAIETGSKFNERAHNKDSDAKGLFQFTPETARAYGIAGREYDPVANADAGARLYKDNKMDIELSHGRTGRPYLSHESNPNGFDLYIAHQQGATGYGSIQAALDPKSGSFLHGAHTRDNLLGNIGDDVERLTGKKLSALRGLSDHDLAQTFVNYWQKKYNDISIPEHGIKPITGASLTSTSNEQTIADPAMKEYFVNVVAALQKVVADGSLKLPEGVSVEDVASRMMVDASNQKLGALDFSKADSVAVNVSKDGTVGVLTQGATTIAITPFSGVSPGEARENIGQMDKAPGVPAILASASPSNERATMRFA
jgi:hypothetical protein